MHESLTISGFNFGRAMVVVALTLTFQETASQSGPTFQHLSMEDGLSSNIVYTVIQDNTGFIWIGGGQGVDRFDGKSVVHFDICDNEPTTSSAKDDVGLLWFGTSSRVTSFDPTTHTESIYEPPKGRIAWDAESMLVDEHGTLWVGTPNGLYSFDRERNIFTSIQRDTLQIKGRHYYSDRITCMAADMNGSLWVGTLAGLYNVSTDTHQFRIIEGINPKLVQSQHIRGLAFDQHGLLWVSTNDSGVFTYDYTSKKFISRKMPDDEKQFRTLFFDGEELWLATATNGIITIDKHGEILSHTNDPYDPASIAGDNVSSFYHDISGMIWIGTFGYGVDRVSHYPEKFSLYSHQPARPGGFSAGQVYSADEDASGNIWLATYKGLVYFDRRNNKFKYYRHDPGNPNSPSLDAISDVKVDPGGQVWIATDNSLDCFNPKSELWKSYPLYTEGIRRKIFCIYFTSAGEMLLGTEAGVRIFNTSTQQFETREQNEKLSSNLPSRFYFHIFEDSRHMLWFVTGRSGVLQLTSDFDIPPVFDANKIPDRHIHYVSEDEDGNIWLAGGEGIYRYDHKNGEVRKFTSGNGREYNSVVPVSSTVIWLGTTKGLTRMTLLEDDSVQFKDFVKSDGLQGTSFTSACLKLASGELLFGGANGFNLFSPQEVRLNDYMPTIAVTKLEVADRSINLFSGQPVVLDHQENFFSFQMSALNFDHPQKNEFAYQLLGFDKQQIYSGTRNFASYTNVPPGNYVLHVIGSNNDGLWNNEGVQLAIIIRPPFWQLVWVQGMAGVLLLTAIALGFVVRSRSIRKTERERAELNRRIAEARHAALRAQMNPHFIFNCLNSINKYIIKSQPEQASSYLIKFSKLIRLVLENSATEMISLEDEIFSLELYIQLEQLRFENKFTSSIKINPAVVPSEVHVQPMILQPFVENAIWHGLLRKPGAGELTIEVAQDKMWIICKITDNGIGRKKAAQVEINSTKHKGFGISATISRLQNYSDVYREESMVDIEDLVDKDGNPAGTCVTVRVAPVKTIKV